jgi:hypothetical protein
MQGGSRTILGEVNVVPALTMVDLVRLSSALLDAWSLMMIFDLALKLFGLKREVDFMANPCRNHTGTNLGPNLFHQVPSFHPSLSVFSRVL